MPTEFKNVSEITQRLMDIIQINSNLKDVWIQGIISNIDRPQNGHVYFTLKDNVKEIECVIFNNWAPLQKNLPAAGNNVSVKGQIYVYGTKSEYKFMVKKINLSEDPLPDQSVPVSTLMENWEGVLSVHSDEVQGQISEVFRTETNFTILKLKDTAINEKSDDIIECVLPPEIDPTFPLKIGEKVQVIGKFGVFSKTSAYRIEVDDVKNITQVTGKPKKEKPVLNKCEGCHQHFSKLQDQLCHICYDASRTSEGIVVGAVLRYFDAPIFAKFSTKREHRIQFGTKHGRADVVLLDSQGNLTAIAECKRIGFDGNSGIAQLEAYLSASGTILGLFAVDTNPYEWIFLQNLGKGKFTEITRSDFETMVRDEKAQPSPEPRNPNPIPPPIPSNPASRLWQYITGVLGVALCICLTVLIMQLDEKNRKIQDNTRTISQLKSENKKLTEANMRIQNSDQTISQLKSENKTLVDENQTLQEQITKKDKQLEEYIGKNSKLESENANLREQITGKPPKSGPGKLLPPNPDVKIPIEPKPPPPKPIPKLLNINTATAKELNDLPVSGIGEKLSERIIQYRKQNGNFATVDDITKVPGIGEKTLEKLRSFICVE